MLFFLSVQFLYGQGPLFNRFEHFDTEKGIPQSNVTEIAQDQDGFIWVSTMGGLVRYDGREFVPFSKELTSQQIFDMRLDESNRLWVMHFNHKVDVIDPRTFEVTKDVSPVASIDKALFPLQIDFNFSLRIYEDTYGKNWFIDDYKKYYLFDSENEDLKKYFDGTIKKTQTFIHSFCQDSKGRFWTMTNHGLEVRKMETLEVKQFKMPKEFNYTPNVTDTQKILVELSGDRFLFGYFNRFFIYHERDDRFTELETPLFERGDITKSDMVVFDAQNRPIFELDGMILRLEPDETLTLIWEFPNRKSLFINSIFIDNSNVLWIAANTDGLYKIDLNTPTFNPTPYTYNLIVEVLHKEMNIPYTKMPQRWLKKGWSYGLRYHYLTNGELLLTNDDRHYGYLRDIHVLANGEFQRLGITPLQNVFIQGIGVNINGYWAIDYKGNLLTMKDLSGPILETHPVQDYLSKTGSKPLDGTTTLINDMVVDEEYQWLLEAANRIYQCQDGVIISTYEPTSDNASLVSMVQDISDPSILWIGTLGGGLIKWDKTSKRTLRAYSMIEGLPNNSIAAIAADTLGQLWLATFKGLSKFNISNESFTNYSIKDGLLESEFNRHHQFILPNGNIAFGGTQGYVQFNPYEFRDDDFEPMVNITQLAINNQPIAFGDSTGILSLPINQLPILELSYDQNAIVFDIAAMQYNDPSRNQYRYELMGFTHGWVEIENDNQVRFDKLPFGTYTLRVNATNSRGIWSSHIRELKIRVNPPPWLSWWAFVIYGFILIIVITYIIRTYKRKLIRAQQDEYNMKEAIRLREMDEMKTRFFSNITHEFRTPLTLILSPLDKHIKDESFPPKALEVLKSNYRHGSHLLKLVNQLLDIAKLESGNMQLHEASGELTLFVQGCVDQFAELAQQKGISIFVDTGNVNGNYLFDKSNWQKILFNLLSNAVKFTTANGPVTLSLKEEEKEGELLVGLEVRDSGIGIKEEALPKLFDRFYQVDDSTTREQEGTGIGLALVKELVELMRGNISVESAVGEGTTFTVLLPISKFLETVPVEVEQELEDNPEVSSESSDEMPLLLVVEDNQELRAFIVESLADSWQVIEAPTGSDAWQLIQKELPDIVISDVMMPGMSGYELCQLTKGDIRTAHINFIMLTAKTAQESKEKGLEAGADDYLTKPFHVHELSLRIQNQLLQQQRIREHLQNELLMVSPGGIVPNVADEFVNKLRNYIDEHISDASLNIDQLTDHFAMSRSTLNRKLKSLLNISPNEYIKMHRLQQAAVLLKAGTPISDVAHQVGFESPSYFSQCFKEVYHFTPSEFQKTADLNQRSSKT